MPYSLVDNGVDEDNNSIAGKLKLAQLAGLTPPGLDLMRGLDPMGNNIANPQLQIPNQGIGMPSMPKLPDYEPTRDAPPPGPQPDLRSANSGIPSPTNKFDFKKLFLGSHEPSSVDEYGLTKPGSNKIGLLGALLGSLPATLYGASQGLGLTGLGVGLGAAGKQNMQQDEQASKDYQTNRAMAQKVDYENKSLAQQAENSKASQDLARATLENSKDYQGKTISIAQQNADTSAAKVNKESAADAKIAQKTKEAQDQRDGLLANLDELEKSLSGIKSGPISGRIANFGASYGIGASKDAITKFHGLVTGLKLQYGKDFSGRYNNAEGAEIESKLLPILSLPKDQQAYALDAARTLIYNKFNQVKDPYIPGSGASSSLMSPQYDRAAILAEKKRRQLIP